MPQLCIRVGRRVRGVHQALLNRALVSTIERKVRVEVAETEVGPQGYRQRPALRPEFML